MDNVYEGLLGFDEKGEFIPAIAESYTISDDGLTYTFQIKTGIQFHDGKDCTAKDVKYTYEKLAGSGRFQGFELHACEGTRESGVPG